MNSIAAAQTASQSSHQWVGPKHCRCTAAKSHSKLPSLNQVRSLLKASIPFLNLVSVQFHTFMQMPACAADSLSPKQSKFKWSSANRVSDRKKKKKKQKTCGHQQRRSPWEDDKVKTEWCYLLAYRISSTPDSPLFVFSCCSDGCSSFCVSQNNSLISKGKFYFMQWLQHSVCTYSTRSLYQLTAHSNVSALTYKYNTV